MTFRVLMPTLCILNTPNYSKMVRLILIWSNFIKIKNEFLRYGLLKVVFYNVDNRIMSRYILHSCSKWL